LSEFADEIEMHRHLRAAGRGKNGSARGSTEFLGNCCSTLIKSSAPGRTDGFLDHLGQAIFDATRERRSCTMPGRSWRFFPARGRARRRPVFFAGAGFLPEAGKGGIQEALNFVIGFHRQFFGDQSGRVSGITSPGATA